MRGKKVKVFKTALQDNNCHLSSNWRIETLPHHFLGVGHSKETMKTSSFEANIHQILKPWFLVF